MSSTFNYLIGISKNPCFDRSYEPDATVGAIRPQPLTLLFWRRVQGVFRGSLIDLEFIQQQTWKKALSLTELIDEFDAPFITISLELGSPLWARDKSY